MQQKRKQWWAARDSPHQWASFKFHTEQSDIMGLSNDDFEEAFIALKVASSSSTTMDCVAESRIIYLPG